MLYIITLSNQSLSANGKKHRQTERQEMLLLTVFSTLSKFIYSAIKMKNLDYYREENSFYMKSCVFLTLSFLTEDRSNSSQMYLSYSSIKESIKCLERGGP